MATVATATESRLHWIDTATGFRAGTPGESGQNLYVNRDGALETIRRFDLDGNGHLDLLFNCTHDTYNALPATFVCAARNHTLRTSEFAVDGSSRVLTADLNRDGFADLVFMPNRQNVQRQRSSIIIAWGDADGWSTQRLTRQLPVHGVRSIAVGDVNRDGWSDIVTLNGEGWLFGQPPGRILRTYWGGPHGFTLHNFQDLGVPDAVEVVVGTFGARAEFTAAVVTADCTIHLLAPHTAAMALKLDRVMTWSESAGGTRVKAQCVLLERSTGSAADRLLIGTNGGILLQATTDGTAENIKTFAAVPATHLALGKLDGDEWADLVLTQQHLRFPNDHQPPPAASVTILWGGIDGWSAQRRTARAIPNASAAAIGDLDGDGCADLMVAVYQGDQSTRASSQILLGDATREFSGQPIAVTTEGATDVVIARPTPDAAPTAIFPNSQRRTLDDAVPLRLYWGSANGFSPQAFTDIANLSGYKSSAADLNGDGHVDLVVTNGADVTEETSARAPYSGANIYWGGREGSIRGPGPTRFDPGRRQVLPERHLGSINVADLNTDGYLDLVLGAFESPEKPDTDLVIYYGSSTGYSPEHRQALRGPGRSIGCLIADFNRDGRLDIVIGSYGKNQVITYWGSAVGFSLHRRTVMAYPAPIDLEAADLNNDGWLDLLVASYEDSVAHHHDTGTAIFWGRREGWHQSHSQWLPGITPVGLAVADLDADGWLDMVSPHYHGELSRERLPSYIFWGSERGFAALRRTSLIVDSASEAVIADFDRDGRLDLAFAAHSLDPGHVLSSPIFFNDGRRFEAPRVQYLPATGPHYMWVQDIGNIRHRRHEESFTSRIFTWAEPVRGGTLTLDVALPHGARVKSFVRSAPSGAAIENTDWCEVAGETFSLPHGARALQYRLDLLSANGDAYPIVRRVELALR